MAPAGKNNTAAILLAFGSIDTVADIPEFLKNIMDGKEPSGRMVSEVEARYKAIGGKSPLLEITRAQAAIIADLTALPVRVGMRFWKPFITDELEKLADDGFTRLIPVPMTPYTTSATGGAYMSALTKSLYALPPEISDKFEIVKLPYWRGYSEFVESFAKHVYDAITAYTHGETDDEEKFRILFTAHSLPVIQASGEAYTREIYEVVHGILGWLEENIPWKTFQWDLAFQSRGIRPGEWLKPDAEEVIDKYAAEDVTQVLVVPVGFISDHVETLYDIDIALKNYAGDRGIALSRVGSLNTDRMFLSAIARAINGVKNIPSKDNK